MNWIPRELPDLFGNTEILKRKTIKKTGFSKRKKRKSTKSNSGVWSLFPEDPKIASSAEIAQKLNQEEYERFMRMLADAQELGLSLNSDSLELENKIYIQDQQLADNKLEAREYLLTITRALKQDNGIVILPTGLGKTYIATVIMLAQLRKTVKKILFLAPTKPLVQQHVLTLQSLLPKISVNALTGYTSPKKRNALWENSQIIVATPQTITAELNKQKKGSIVGCPEDISVLIVDELHHQVGNYDYVSLVKFYQEENSKIQFLGFTASPDPSLELIKTWMKELKVKKSGVQVRNFDSSDVLPYTYYRQIIPYYLKRELNSIQKEFKLVLSRNLTKLILEMVDKLTISIKGLVYTNEEALVVGIKISEFNALRKAFQRGIKLDNKKTKAYQLLGLYGLVMVYNSALLALNKGLPEFVHFLERQYSNFLKERKKFQISFCNNLEIQNIIKVLYFNHLWSGDLPVILKNKNWSKSSESAAWKISLNDEKLKLVLDIVEKQKKQVLVFTNYRDTLRKLEYYLKNNSPKKVGILTGTSSKLNDPGMSQVQQLATLADFKAEKIKVLISTSVGEEGLDFPAVDTVIFYEPIADVRRYIQRLGRTARHQRGLVYILIYRDTEEEALFYVAKNREKRVREIIEYLARD